MKTFNLNRKVYKDSKKKDHQQMNDFITAVYKQGFDDGLKSASINYEALKEVLLSIKGIGPLKVEAVINKIKEIFNQEGRNAFNDAEYNYREYCKGHWSDDIDDVLEDYRELFRFVRDIKDVIESEV